MITKTIKYTDFNGKEREEEALFNLTRTELMEIAVDLPEGLIDNVTDEEKTTDEQRAKAIFAALGGKGVSKFIKDMLLKSYGIKSLDGRRFEKSEQISTEFSQTMAFDQLYYELLTDDVAAAQFINGIIPESILDNAISKMNNKE